MDDVEAIERATLAAVPPLACEELAGWLLALDPGTVGRCHSAAPLRHAAPEPGTVAAIEARYAAHGLPAVFRVPGVRAFDGLRAELALKGYAEAKPTCVQRSQVGEVLALAGPGMEVELAGAPQPQWEAVFLGEGFDPVDGASRAAILRRGRASLFAGVWREGQLVAVGAGCFSHGWLGVHGMRTLPAWRGQGLARGVIAALLREAQARGIARVFLQVEQANAAARALYAGLGFVPAWSYGYWKRVA